MENGLRLCRFHAKLPTPLPTNMISRYLKSSMHRVAKLLILGILFGSPSTISLRADSFELKEGDRVAFLGDAFFERTVRFGQIETALAARWPDRKIVFRNIGWAGDGPEGRARAFFDPIEKGFENLKMHLGLADPTVVVIQYGSMAAFERREGLASFKADMNALLDTIESETDARIAILSPTPREYRSYILSDPRSLNRDLEIYVDALKALAKSRGAFFVDLFNTLETSTERNNIKPITTNGIHLNEYGYFLVAERIAQAFSEYSSAKAIEVTKGGDVAESSGINLVDARVSKDSIVIELQDERLSLPPLGGDFSRNLTLAFADLPRGEYRLEFEGRVLATGSAGRWKQGIQLAWEPSNDQATALQETIKRKNELFFHQWRPQNETYLRGFRKHEQGQNVKELPMWDAFIEKEEMKIGELKKPKPYRLVLKKAHGGEG